MIDFRKDFGIEDIRNRPNKQYSNIYGFMVSEWKEPNENKKYLDLFSLKNSEQLPCFIAFKFNDDETIEQVVS